MLRSRTNTTAIVATISMLVIAGLAFFFVHEPKVGNATIHMNPWVKEANILTGSQYGFTLVDESIGMLLGDFSCNQNAPKGGSVTDGEQYTYCQNSGAPVKVSLAWKQADVSKGLFLKRVANTVSEYTRKNGDFNCREDRSFKDVTGLGGVVSDCVIAMEDGSFYYTSAYFFYPTESIDVSQVLYVYSLNSSADQSVVQNTVRAIAKGIDPKLKRVSFFSVPVAYAQDAGGGGDAGGDSGGDGGGGSDGGGGNGYDGGDGPGDSGGTTGVGDPDGSARGDTGVDRYREGSSIGSISEEGGGSPDRPTEGGGGGLFSDPNGAPPVPPDLRVNKTVVQLGEEVILTWNTHNNDEGKCTLTGGDLAGTHTPIPRNGHNETGTIPSRIHGKAIFVLDCEGVTDSVTVEIIPNAKET